MKLLFAAPLILVLSALTVGASGVQAAGSLEDGQTASEFGEPLVVDGRRISDREIKRFLIYGVGRIVLEMDRLGIFVEQEMKGRARVLEGEIAAELFDGKAAADLSDVERAQVATQVEESLARYRLDPGYQAWLGQQEADAMAERYPTLDLDTELARSYGSPELHDLLVAGTLEFDQCFFPGDPAEWPALTCEILWASSTEVDLVEDMKIGWGRRVAGAEDRGEPYVRREEEIYFGVLRDEVVRALLGVTVIRTADDGLPEEYVLSMEGEGWSVQLETDEVYSRVAPWVSERDILVAKRWLAVMAATEGRLEREGHLVSLEEHYAHLAKTDVELEQSFMTLDYIATDGHGFPSTQAFRRYLRPFESYRNLMKQVLVPEANGTPSPILVEYLPHANKVLGLARSDAEVMLISAFDQANFTWKENGWDLAKEEAVRVRAEIDEQLDRLEAAADARHAAAENGVNYEPDPSLLPFGPFWSQMLDEHSEFWDAPMPASGKMPTMETLNKRGRFGSLPRNDLAGAVGESMFYKILTGRSIADRVFQDMSPGDVGGPFRGTQGYYIVYLKSRRPPTKPIGSKSRKDREMLEDEYVRQTFAEFAQESLILSEVSELAEL